MRIFQAIWLFLFEIFMVLISANPFGLGQIVIWQFRPPYHWVSPPSIIKESVLVDKNGRVCGDVYLNLEEVWHVYGYGFSRNYNSRDEAIQKANRECR